MIKPFFITTVIWNIYRNRYLFSTRFRSSRNYCNASTVTIQKSSSIHGQSVPVRAYASTGQTNDGDTKVGQYWQMRRYICQALLRGVGGWPAGADERLERIVIARIVWCVPDDSKSTPGLPSSCLNFVSSTLPRRTAARGNEYRWFTGSFSVTRVRHLPPFHLPRRMSHSS